MYGSRSHFINFLVKLTGTLWGDEAVFAPKGQIDKCTDGIEAMFCYLRLS